MKVYFVGPPGSDLATWEQQMEGKHVLYSFATCRGLDVPAKASGYCLDSGAFTAWKQKRTIDIDRLTAWYEQHDTADFKLALDVIGGTESQQKENLYALERNGIDVVPVFHGPRLESWKWFDELCERYSKIAIGSVIQNNKSPEVTHWLRQIFNRICDKETMRPSVRVHGLRMCIRMREFPFDSVDGATWVIASKNGWMPGLDGLSQVKAPRNLTSRQLQTMWIQSWSSVPKCETYQHTPILFPDL